MLTHDLHAAYHNIHLYLISTFLALSPGSWWQHAFPLFVIARYMCQ